MKKAFSFGGDLRSLRIPVAVDDPRSVTFGRNHDTIRELNDQAINPYNEPSDAFLATAYVLARQRGTPLILNWDNYDVPYIQYGVKFRQIMQQRGSTGGNVTENVLAVIDDPTVLLMERGDAVLIGNESLRPTDLELLYNEKVFQNRRLGSVCFHDVSMNRASEVTGAYTPNRATVSI
jgi:alpha-amylase